MHKLTSEILVNSDIFITSISDKKYHKISLNFFSEIWERIIYLFSIDKIIVLVLSYASLTTYKTHSL
nr:MAG TPA: hypothetical protein [Caudoviricetes sp.]